MSFRRPRRALRHLCLASIVLIAGCAQQVDQTPSQELDYGRPAGTSAPRPQPLIGVPLSLGPGRPTPGNAIVERGAEALRLGHGASLPVARAPLTGPYVLNFDNVDVRDVVKSVLGDMLHVNYVIDPAVQGTLSLHTASPLARESVLPAFEQALKAAGIVMVAGAAGYEIIPLQGAAQRGALRLNGERSGASGYGVEVIPLKYVAAADIQRLLEPVLPGGTIVQVDPQRNLIVLAGTSTDLARANQTVSLFDVDWLRSQSIGLFPLRYSQAKAIAADLDAIVGAHGPLSGLVRIVAIDHLNAILVVSPKIAYVNELQQWIERFDRGRDVSQSRMYVYHVQNGRATDLANVLTRALGRGGAAGAASASDASAPSTAPSAQPVEATATPAGGLSSGLTSAGGQPNPLLGGLSNPDTAATSPLGDVRITADEGNNALLIVATSEKYALVESALQQLDIVPLQVLLEAAIAEVNLTSELKYGVQYYFQSGALSGLASSVAAGSLAPSTGGLSLAYLKGNSIQAVLDLLSSISTVKVVSAPKLLVINNHTASLQVGDEVPIATSSAVGVTTANAPIVNTIQLLDTGIILHVTPRVSSGGLVLLDVTQEVSASAPTTSSNINSPTISKRKVSSSIAIGDGQTIAIGGLISDTRTKSRSGIPLLMDIPYVGALFSLTDNQVNRTELIVLMTPHVIRDQTDMLGVTDELRTKLPLIRGFNDLPKH